MLRRALPLALLAVACDATPTSSLRAARYPAEAPTAPTPPVTPGAPTPPTPTPAPTPTPEPETPGSLRPVDPGATPGANPGELPLDDPDMNDGHVGRAPRRVDVRQFRAALIQSVGVSWIESRRIASAEVPGGSYVDPNADMLLQVAATLGQPNYLTSTSESTDPNATFAKLIGDAARKACRDGIALDLRRAPGERILLRHAAEGDTLASNPEAVRRNLAYLALRFWARQLAPTDATLAGLARLFETASTLPAAGALPAGTPADGWRAVCIALVTDNQFLTY